VKLAWVGVALSCAACGPRVVEQDTNADGDGTAGSHTDTEMPGSSSGPTQSDATSDASTSREESSSTGGPEVCLGRCDCEPSGALLWERVYPTAPLEQVHGWDLAVDADGNLVVAGTHRQFTPEDRTFGQQSMWLALLDAEAMPLWSVTSGPMPAGTRASLDGGRAVHVDVDGRILVAGDVDGAEGWSGGALWIHGPDGELLDEILDQPIVGSAWRAVTTDGDGDAIVAGVEHVDGSGGSRAIVRGYGRDGDATFERVFVGTAGESMRNEASGVGIGDGSIFVAGTLSNTHDYGEEDIWLAALDLTFDTRWESLYDSRTELAAPYSDLGWDTGQGLALSPEGGVLVFGDHRVNKPTDTGTLSANERWARLYAADGATQWTWWRDDPAPVPGSARDATFDACGNAIIVGMEEVEGDDTLFVAKLDAGGAVLWERYGHPVTWTVGSVSVVADADGSIVTLAHEADDVLVISRYAP
jgi:hypothetical protein